MVFAMREMEDGVTVTIEDISWERVFLRVSYRAERPVQLKLFRVRTRQFADFRETQEGDLVTAVVNITQGGGREPLADGEWIICQQLSDEEASLSWARASPLPCDPCEEAPLGRA